MSFARSVGAKIALVLLLLAPLSFAAEHHGIVKFGGLPLPGVTVTAAQGDKHFSAVTDLQGVYSFPDLADGVWNFHIEMLCFETLDREVAVSASAPAAEWSLKLLSYDVIKAAAPPPPTPAPSPTPAASPAATPAATTAAAAAQTPVKPSSKKVDPKKTPPPAANTASAFQRADVNASPGATNGANPNAATNGASGNNVDSATPEDSGKASDGFLVNGSVNNGAASPFAQSAAFGNNRRGPRSLYNVALGFTLDNSAWDARAYSITGQNTPQPDFNRMTGTLSMGGPLRIPGRHLLRGNPVNLTINYSWMRNRNASVHTGLLPTDADRIGDFSARGITIYDPDTKVPFAGGIIPQNRISQQAKSLLQYFPEPNFTDPSYNFQIPTVQNTHTDGLQTRWNKTAGRKNNLSGQFGYQNTRGDSTNLYSFLDTTASAGLQNTVNWMHRFSMRTFSTLSYTYSHFATHSYPFFANRVNVSGEAGIGGNDQTPANWGPPGLNFATGFAGLSDGNAAFNRFQTNALTASFFYSYRSHNITAGGDYRRQQFNFLSQQNPRGSFQFTGGAAGYDFAGFLLGTPDTSAIAFGNADKYFRSSTYVAYVNDDWRFSPGLTLNGGIRWEYSSPITELYGRLVNLDVGSGFTHIAPVIGYNPVGSITGQTYPDSLINPYKGAIMPRLGISWRPLLASSMVVRAGYGIYYDTSVYLPLAMQMAQQSPLSKSLNAPRTPDNPITMANGFTLPPNISSTTFAVDRNFKVGYAQNWQLGVQRDMPAGMVLNVTYFGAKGTHGRQQFLPNTYPNGVANPCAICESGYYYLWTYGNSISQQVRVQVRRRMHNGFTGTVLYTLSKIIDDGAMGGQGGAGGGASASSQQLLAQNWLDLRSERALSSIDQRHQLTLSGQYSTGVGLGGGTLLSGWRGGLFKDWTLTSQLIIGSGHPLSPIYYAPANGTGIIGTIRPTYVGDVYDAPPGRNLNPDSVVPPFAGQWGNAGRNSIIGPYQLNLSSSLARTFRLGDRLNADLRFDSDNPLNHPTYSSWVTVAQSAQFGLAPGANAMRSLRATLRLRY